MHELMDFFTKVLCCLGHVEPAVSAEGEGGAVVDLGLWQCHQSHDKTHQRPNTASKHAREYRGSEIVEDTSIASAASEDQ